MATVLLEIGTEEIPAGYISGAMTRLANRAQSLFANERIAFEEMHAWATPRRLVLYLTGVAEHQAPTDHEVRGPAVRDAFAGSGEPTPAAIGFARSQGITVNELRIKQYDGAEYVVSLIHDEGQPAIERLPIIFHELIISLTFPKTMRWGNGAYRFARPIRWIVALMDEQVIPLTIDAITAGRHTRGHRFLSLGEVEVASAAEYPRLLDDNLVMVDQDTRRGAIHWQLEEIARKDDARVLDDGFLLNETVFSLEYPTAVRGAVDTTLLSLPDAVLLQVLRYEQRYFPLVDSAGRLLPAFVAVRDGDRAFIGEVREGYEMVVRAKLLDALFFFEQDRQRPLASRMDALRGTKFLEHMGTLYDKAKRLETLASLIAAWLELSPEERQLAGRAAYLAKADLVTAVVSEHPELNGAMGQIYAGMSGEPESVAIAIGEQYQPRMTEDPIPATLFGRIVALADKVDTVAACFAAGLMPTAQEDPYGLIEAARGAIRILTEGQLRLSISQLISRALRQLTLDSSLQCEAVQLVLEDFFQQQLHEQFKAHNLSSPVIQAALALFTDSPADIWHLANFLQTHREDSRLKSAIQTAVRLTALLRGGGEGEPTVDLLTQPAELTLLTRLQESSLQVEQAAGQAAYDELLRLLESLVPDVTAFLEETHILVDDLALRQARLGLVSQALALFRLLGDITVLGKEPGYRAAPSNTSSSSTTE